jgi:hypothetical protein
VALAAIQNEATVAKLAQRFENRVESALALTRLIDS